jgi:hypothetical protein
MIGIGRMKANLQSAGALLRLLSAFTWFCLSTVCRPELSVTT